MEQILPFMRLQGEQKHITESYVSVPPALTITDEQGAIWTLGSMIAPKDKTPDGEFAFNVLRNGVEIGEIASRIERRNGKVRIFTIKGWKVMLPRAEQVIVKTVFEITADYLDQNESPVPIEVLIYKTTYPNTPVIAFSFNSTDGGGWLPDMGTALLCQGEEWLFAKITPANMASKIQVMANDGWNHLIEIPVHQGLHLV